MKTLDPAIVAAYQRGEIVRRNCVWITARDRATGELHSKGFWNDIETVGVPVIDGLTQQSVTRTYVAAGGLIKVGDIVLTSDLTVRRVTITLSPLNEDAAQYIYGYDLRLGPIQIHRPLFDPVTWDLVADADCRFVGAIEKAPTTRPKAGGKAKATLRCVSRTIELTIPSVDARSDDSQQRRDGDRYFRYAETMGDRDVPWGDNPQ